MTLKIITDWLGEGGATVPIKQAEDRADVCANCPMNVRHSWFGRLKEDVASVIRSHLEIKNDMGLVLKNEHKIGFCTACGCVLTLKCLTPIEHIGKHTSPEQVEKLWDKCWIRKELGY